MDTRTYERFDNELNRLRMAADRWLYGLLCAMCLGVGGAYTIYFIWMAEVPSVNSPGQNWAYAASALCVYSVVFCCLGWVCSNRYLSCQKEIVDLVIAQNDALLMNFLQQHVNAKQHVN